MYEIAICDDMTRICEEVYRMVSELLLKRDIDTRIHIYTSGKELLKAGIVFDILFLDIELDKENGLEIARDYSYGKETRIIFLTSHIEEMPNGYKVRAFRFLTKPVEHVHFEEALMSAIKNLEHDKRLTVADEAGEHIIRASEILYVEAQQRSTGIRTRDKFARSSLAIEEMKKELNMTQFYCPHKSYIVNMDYIRSIGKGEVVLKNDERITVSRLKMKDFKEKFYDYLRSRANGF